MVVKTKKGWRLWASSILTVITLLLVATVLTIFLRLYVIASYHVSTSSMEPTIMPGDYILVNQLVLGARYFKEETDSDGKIRVVAKRIPGLRKVKRNDILVFNLPKLESMDMDVSVHYVKRCVAIPGDTFYIQHGFYRVQGVADTLGYLDYQLRFSVMDRSTIPWGAWRTAPMDSLHQWSVKDMGPLYLPKAGDRVPITLHNIGLYKNAMMYESNQQVWISRDTIYLGKTPIQSYVFKYNYYFMAGDNVFDSGDSRYWGLLPEDHIIGKASMIWKSKDMQTKKYHFKRFFKNL